MSDKRPVAIIAVHGIADQEPYSSARSIADLLNSDPKQSGSRENFIRIPVNRAKPVKPPKSENEIPNPSGKNRVKKFADRVKKVADCIGLIPFHNIKSSDLKNIEINYLDRQLGGDGEGEKVDHYQTIRIDLDEEVGNSPVHIYEMHWADLSRLNFDPFQFLKEFYQLIFHVASLGRNVVHLSYLENSSENKKYLWKIYCHLQNFATTSISLWIPIFNLQLLLVLFVVYLSKNLLSFLDGALVLPFVNFIVTGLVIFLIISLKDKIKSKNFIPPDRIFLLCILFFLISPLLIIGIDKVVHSIIGFSETWCRNILWCSVYIFLVILIDLFVINFYNQRRPGALGTHRLASGLTGVFFLWHADHYFYGVEHQIPWISFRVLEFLFVLLGLLWVIFLCAYVFSMILGWLCEMILSCPCKKREIDTQLIKRIQRSNWTARISLAVPSTIYFVFTMSLWSGLSKLNENLNLIQSDQKCWYELSDWFRCLVNSVGFKSLKPNISGKITEKGFLDFLLNQTISPLFCINILLIIFSIFLMILAFIPSINKELNPPNPSDNDSTKELGKWLDDGFWWIKNVAACFLIINIALIFPLGFFIGIFCDLSWFQKYSGQLFDILSYLIVLIIGALFLLKIFFIPARGVLDAILDVDNYMRVHPFGMNARARTFARYLSLIKYINTQRKYRGIIIIAHSQGSVISADVLRYLKYLDSFDRNPCKSMPRTYLFTMGSPIYQLYRFAFPHLYSWAEHKQEGVSLGYDTLKDDFGLECWVNTYGSGDYVGRHLWSKNYTKESPNFKEKFEAWRNILHAREFYARNYEMCPLELSSGSRKSFCYEFCLGPLAHTHYWDGTRPEVADVLKEMINSFV